MALTEQRILKSITVNVDSNTISVQHADQVLRDGEVISEQFHRKAYAAEQQEEFEAEVTDAAKYIGLITWGPVDENQPPRIPQVVTIRQARLALLQAGLLEAVEAAIAQAEQSVQIEWEYATEIRRAWPALVALQPTLGLTDEQVDELFVLAAGL